MSAERLGDILNSGNYGRPDLGRIHLAYQLEREINLMTHEKIGVKIRGRVIQIICLSPAQARSLELQRGRLEGTVKKLTGGDPYTLKIKLSNS